MPSEPQIRLEELRNGLLKLHQRLLASERSAYERDVARIESPGQFLNLLLTDPWFAWLRELSQFIVMIDEAVAAKEPVTGEEADRILTRARSLVVPAENGDPFSRRYWESAQRDPDVVLAHGDMMQVFRKLGL
jgi:hypothetical protein